MAETMTMIRQAERVVTKEKMPALYVLQYTYGTQATKKAQQIIAKPLLLYGAPGAIRMPDLLIRSLNFSLYMIVIFN